MKRFVVFIVTAFCLAVTRAEDPAPQGLIVYKAQPYYDADYLEYQSLEPAVGVSMLTLPSGKQFQIRNQGVLRIIKYPQFPDLQTPKDLESLRQAIGNLQSIESEDPKTTRFLDKIVTDLSSQMERFQSGQKKIKGAWNAPAPLPTASTNSAPAPTPLTPILSSVILSGQNFQGVASMRISLDRSNIVVTHNGGVTRVPLSKVSPDELSHLPTDLQKDISSDPALRKAVESNADSDFHFTPPRDFHLAGRTFPQVESLRLDGSLIRLVMGNGGANVSVVDLTPDDLSALPEALAKTLAPLPFLRPQPPLEKAKQAESFDCVLSALPSQAQKNFGIIVSIDPLIESESLNMPLHMETQSDQLLLAQLQSAVKSANSKLDVYMVGPGLYFISQSGALDLEKALVCIENGDLARFEKLWDDLPHGKDGLSQFGTNLKNLVSTFDEKVMPPVQQQSILILSQVDAHPSKPGKTNTPPAPSKPKDLTALKACLAELVHFFQDNTNADKSLFLNSNVPTAYQAAFLSLLQDRLDSVQSIVFNLSLKEPVVEPIRATLTQIGEDLSKRIKQLHAPLSRSANFLSHAQSKNRVEYNECELMTDPRFGNPWQWDSRIWRGMSKLIGSSWQAEEIQQSLTAPINSKYFTAVTAAASSSPQTWPSFSFEITLGKMNALSLRRDDNAFSPVLAGMEASIVSTANSGVPATEFLNSPSAKQSTVSLQNIFLSSVDHPATPAIAENWTQAMSWAMQQPGAKTAFPTGSPLALLVTASSPVGLVDGNDAALACAIYSATGHLGCNRDITVLGSLNAGGKLGPVSLLSKRVENLSLLGSAALLISQSNRPDLDAVDGRLFFTTQVITCKDMKDVISLSCGKTDRFQKISTLYYNALIAIQNKNTAGARWCLERVLKEMPEHVSAEKILSALPPESKPIPELEALVEPAKAVPAQPQKNKPASAKSTPAPAQKPQSVSNNE